MSILTINDVAAGAIGYMFAHEFVYIKASHQAIQSLIVSNVV